MNNRTRAKRIDRAFHPVVVFLGPSLHQDEARTLLDADYLPPARKGDVYRILASGVKTIVLIDGLFHTTPSVWHRELLDAIEEGIDVVGASSMGALRAAELRRFGMIGCGTVFEWYRDGKIDGDDEVALWHASAEFDFRPLSEPLVNIRATLARAVDDACLTAGQAEDLVADAKRTYYPLRSSHGRETEALSLPAERRCQEARRDRRASACCPHPAKRRRRGSSVSSKPEELVGHGTDALERLLFERSFNGRGRAGAGSARPRLGRDDAKGAVTSAVSARVGETARCVVPRGVPDGFRPTVRRSPPTSRSRRVAGVQRPDARRL